MAARTELVEQLSRVEEAAALIHHEIEAAHTGHPAPVIPITTTNRSVAA